MKAIVQERFGPPDVLKLVDTDPPEVGVGDVLVRVHAAALNPYDWHMMRGDPLIARLMGGVELRKPKARVAGVDAAGRVEPVGRHRGPGLAAASGTSVRDGTAGPGPTVALTEPPSGESRPQHTRSHPAGQGTDPNP
jgi:NADPH:quinone reductase-like Zn-dependent oxidoreductase